MKKITGIISVLLACLLLAGCAVQPSIQIAPAPVTPAPVSDASDASAAEAPAPPQPTTVAQAELANLYSFTGTVEVETTGGTMSAYEGMRLYAGDSLRTGSDSIAYLDLDQGRLLMLDADGELQLQERPNGDLEVVLAKGVILNDVSKGQTEPYTVRAANITMGVLGTVFCVFVDDVTGVAVTDLYEGKLLVTFSTSNGEEHSYTLNPGRRFSADDETVEGSAQQNELITEDIYLEDLSPEMLDMLEEALQKREDSDGVTELLEQIQNLKKERAEDQEQDEPELPQAPGTDPAPAPAPAPVPPPYNPPAPPPSTPASVSPTTASFDRFINASGYTDKTFTLTAGSYALNAVKIGGDTLSATDDYSVSGNEYTIKKETLGALDVGEYTVTFDMSGGTDPTVALTVTDSILVPDVTFAMKHLPSWLSPGYPMYDSNEQLMYYIELVMTPLESMSIVTTEVSADGTPLTFFEDFNEYYGAPEDTSAYCGVMDDDGFPLNIPNFIEGTDHTVELTVNYTYMGVEGTLTQTMAVEIGGLQAGSAVLNAEYGAEGMHVSLEGRFHVKTNAVVPAEKNKITVDEPYIVADWGGEDDIAAADVTLLNTDISADGTLSTDLTITEDPTEPPCLAQNWKTAKLYGLNYPLPYAYAVDGGAWTVVDTLTEYMEVRWENTASIPQVDTFEFECVEMEAGQLLYDGNGLPVFGVRMSMGASPAGVVVDPEGITLTATQADTFGDLTSTSFTLLPQSLDTTLYRSGDVNDFTGGCIYFVELRIPYTYEGTSYTLVKSMRVIVGGIREMTLNVDAGDPHFTLNGRFWMMMGGGAGIAYPPAELGPAEVNIEYYDGGLQSAAYDITLSGEGIYDDTGVLTYDSSTDPLLIGDTGYAQVLLETLLRITVSFNYEVTFSYSVDHIDGSTDQSATALYTAQWSGGLES